MLKPAVAMLAAGAITSLQAVGIEPVNGFLRWLVPVLLVAIAWLVRNGYTDIRNTLREVKADVAMLKADVAQEKIWHAETLHRLGALESDVGYLKGALENHGEAK